MPLIFCFLLIYLSSLFMSIYIKDSDISFIFNIISIFLTDLSFLSGSNLSFAEKEQKNTRQEFSFGDDHCVTRFNFFENYSTD